MMKPQRCSGGALIKPGLKTRLYDAITIALGGVALSGTIITAQAQVQPTPAGNVEKGRLGFVKVGCAQCHGREAQGSPTTGPRLGPNGLPYAAFARYVRAPRLQMPPYTEKILPDADLADLYNFVQSRPKPAAPPALLSTPSAKQN